MGFNANSGDSDGDPQTMSEMNVIPLVDVMLVMLIIMMVTSPFMEQGVNVELPVAGGQSLQKEQVSETPVVLFVSKDKNLRVGDKPVTSKELIEHLQGLLRDRTQKEIFVRADKDVPYGVVAEIMARVQAAGIERIGLVTQPE